MGREILIGKHFAAVSEEGRLVEYIPDDPDEQAEDILTGRVDRIMPSAGCAFVDIGRSRSGYLPLQENSQTFAGTAVRSGDRVLVQIRKEETGEKGAFLTRDLVLPGQYVLFMPMNRHIGVSGKITDITERTRLAETGEKLAGSKFGLVFRTASADAPETELAEETERLQAEWERILQLLDQAGLAETLHHHESPGDMLIRDYEKRGIEKIIRTDELNADYRRQLETALQRNVRLPGGGNLVIDQCEAMTVIDVNSGSDTSGADQGSTIRNVNLEACSEIGIQTRLRNLSGIIIADLIDMKEKEDEDAVLRFLTEVMNRDRIKTVVHGFTSLGLVEMTRKRTGKRLAEALGKQTRQP